MTRCFFGGEGSFGGPRVICSAGVAALCSEQAGAFAAAAADLGTLWGWVVGTGLRLMPGLWPEPCTATSISHKCCNTYGTALILQLRSAALHSKGAQGATRHWLPGQCSARKVSMIVFPRSWAQSDSSFATHPSLPRLRVCNSPDGVSLEEQAPVRALHGYVSLFGCIAWPLAQALHSSTLF